MRDPIFPVITGLTIILLLLPSPWHWKNKNTGTLLYIGWTLLGNLIYFVNSVKWAGNVRDDAPFWCDLSTKLMVGLSVGLSGASLAINRRLYSIATVKQVVVSASDARKNVIIDLCIGIGLPILVMVLHVINQGHRYDILEDIGCWPSMYMTPVAIPTVVMWPIVLGCVSFVYGGLAIWAFLKQRRQFNELLKSNNTGLNVSRYFRLMALASTELLFALPFTLYSVIGNIRDGLHPWISWEDTHARFNRAEYVPAALFKYIPTIWVRIQVTRYALPAAGIIFFVYFGMAGESGVFYKRFFWYVASRFGFKPAPAATPGSTWAARPGTNSAGGRGVGPLASFNVTSTLPSIKKQTSSGFYPTGQVKSTSSSDSYSLDDEQHSDGEKEELSDICASAPPSPSTPSHHPEIPKEVV